LKLKNDRTDVLANQGVTALSERILNAVQSVLGPTESFIPLHQPEFRGNEWAYVKDCIDTGWVSSVGSYVDRIERDLAALTQSSHAIACVNGTAALHMCYCLAGIQPGHEVLVPSLTFVATINPLSYLGATPHFVDSDGQTLAVDPASLDSYLLEIAEIRGGRCFNRITGAVISALIVTHIFGHPADLDALMALCQRWSLVLVEDAAEALGSYYKGRHVGNSGLVSAVSFNGNKIITTGGGGAILTNDQNIARRAKHLTTTAKVAHPWNFVHDEIGFNYRMPNINAALGCAQLEQLPDMLRRKRILAEKFATAFAGMNDVTFIVEPNHGVSNQWLNAIAIANLELDERDLILQRLNDANYMSRPIWMLMHRLAMYQDCPRAPLPNAERLEREIINLPSSSNLADRL
jgi:perosamine synthetase